MKFTRRGLIKGSVATGAASSLFLHSLPANARTLKYGSNKLDWYPAKSSSDQAPVVIFVHGGAWMLGNRRQVGAKARYYTKKGYHFASVSYTLFPAASVQTQALQVGEAINWVQKNADRLSADTNRIAVMGHSAGCHLASLATLTGAASGVKALICNDTRAYDLSYLAKISGGGLPALYASPFANRNNWSAWSPISYAGLKKHPPTLVAWSGGHNRDKISQRFAGALQKEGSEVHTYDGSNRYSHMSINSRVGRERGHITKSIDAFLEDTLDRV